MWSSGGSWQKLANRGRGWVTGDKFSSFWPRRSYVAVSQIDTGLQLWGLHKIYGRLSVISKGGKGSVDGWPGRVRGSPAKCWCQDTTPARAHKTQLYLGWAGPRDGMLMSICIKQVRSIAGCSGLSHKCLQCSPRTLVKNYARVTTKTFSSLARSFK